MLEFQKQVLNQVPFLVAVPICITRMLCGNAARDDGNPSSCFNPMDEFIAVISLIGNDEFAAQIKGFQQFLSQADVIAITAGQDEPQRIA